MSHKLFDFIIIFNLPFFTDFSLNFTQAIEEHHLLSCCC